MCGYWNLPSACGEQSDDGRSSEECLCATFCCPCYWLCCVFFYCCTGMNDIKDTVERKFPEKSYELKQFEWRQRNAPSSLPQRKRTLTLPLENSNISRLHPVRASQRTLDQLQSPLFRLPVEVRQKIWVAAIGGHGFHITCQHKKLQHTICSVCHTPYSFAEASTSWEPCHPLRNMHYPAATRSCQVLALLKTCRWM